MVKKKRLADFRKSRKSSKDISKHVQETENSTNIQLPTKLESSPLEDSRYFNSSFSIMEEDAISAQSKDDLPEECVTEDTSSSTKTVESSREFRSSSLEKDNASLKESNGNSCSTDRKEKGNNLDLSASKKDERPSFEVFMRIRPLEDSGPETSSTRLRSLSVENSNQVLLCTRPSKGKETNGTKHLFTFSHVFPESTLQREIYEVTMPSMVEAVLSGHHGCVVSYGIPSSGKSYTLYGKATSGKHRGVIMRAMESILNTVQNESSPNIQYNITTSFLQIYNERFYDLLDPSTSDNIKLHENGDHMSVEGATRITVKTIDDVSKQLRRSPNRMRDAGSRSHTVFTVHVRREELVTSSDDVISDKDTVKIVDGKMRFVDLVGVERSVKHSSYESPAVGSAEAKTTRSLQLFANVILSLASDRNAAAPYKDSKLTRLLKNALGGDCITRLIVTTSPCPNLAHETLSTLNLAQKACQIVNNPTPSERIIFRDKTKEGDLPSTHAEEQNCREESSRMSSSSDNRLPPIHPHAGHNVAIGTESSDIREALSRRASESDRNDKDSKAINGDKETTGNSFPVHESEGKTSPTSGPGSKGRTKSRNPSISSSVVKLSCLSDENGSSTGSISPDGLMYMQVKSPDTGSKTVSLPQLPASKAGQIVNQNQSPLRRMESQSEMSQRSSSKSPNHGNQRPTGRHKSQKSTEHEAKRSRQTSQPGTGLAAATKSNFASTILPAADSVINGSCVTSPPSSAGRSKKQSPPSVSKSVDVTVPMETNQLQQTATRESNQASVCCSSCREREEKIKSDYDRMILFSKKDRDEKQIRLEEMELEIKKLKYDSAPISQIKMLEEEISAHKTTKEIQSKEIGRLESVVESLKVKLSTMVSSTELTALQELRRKDLQSMDEVKTELVNLKLKSKEESDKLKKDLGSKNDAIKRLEREMTQLRKDLQDKEKQFQEYKKQQEEKAAFAAVELQRIQTRHDVVVAELNAKVASSAKEVVRMKEYEMKMAKQWQDEKENLHRELALAKQTATHSQAELKITQTKLQMFDRQSRLAKSAGARTRVNALPASRRSVRQSLYRDAETEMSNSPESEREDLCARCCKSLNQDDSNDVARDEELRLLLLQDARNREVLIQLKRERNLLCDVMKIMYCRQWFAEEASPHVRRTLRRVGVDPKSLHTLRKTR